MSNNSYFDRHRGADIGDPGFPETPRPTRVVMANRCPVPTCTGEMKMQSGILTCAVCGEQKIPTVREQSF
jgi:hypothetical protein